MTPEGLTFPTMFQVVSVNQTLPSGPRVRYEGAPKDPAEAVPVDLGEPEVAVGSRHDAGRGRQAPDVELGDALRAQHGRVRRDEEERQREARGAGVSHE